MPAESSDLCKAKPGIRSVSPRRARPPKADGHRTFGTGASAATAVTLLLAGVLFTLPASAADPIGEIKTVSGTASIQRAGETLPAQERLAVEEGDVAVTGPDGSMGLLLNDDTTFSLGPSSEVALDSFVYNPTEGALGMAARIARGSMAFLSGKIAAFKPDAVAVSTPTATIGIRGTQFAIDSVSGGRQVFMEDYSQPSNLFGLPPLRFENDPSAADVSTVVLLPEEDGSLGAVQVGNRAGARTIDTARGAVTVISADQAPSEVYVMAENEVGRRYGPAIAALPPAPASFSLYFEPGTTNLTVDSQALLAEVIAAVEVRESGDILVAGHTDRTGSAALNEQLSLARADAVRAALSAGGVSAAAISIRNFGESEPAVPTADGVAEPRNRRVEVRVR